MEHDVSTYVAYRFGDNNTICPIYSNVVECRNPKNSKYTAGEATWLELMDELVGAVVVLVLWHLALSNQATM